MWGSGKEDEVSLGRVAKALEITEMFLHNHVCDANLRIRSIMVNSKMFMIYALSLSLSLSLSLIVNELQLPFYSLARVLM